MYTDTVTVFNRYRSRFGDTWYPTILQGVNLNIDKAKILSTYGEQSQDNVVMNVRYNSIGGFKTVDGKPYLLPKEWENQINSDLGSTVTFKEGDFFICSDYGSEEPVQDDDFEDGFYNYMNDKYDRVFAITSVSEFSVIPHLEITGR